MRAKSPAVDDYAILKLYSLVDTADEGVGGIRHENGPGVAQREGPSRPRVTHAIHGRIHSMLDPPPIRWQYRKEV